jgi:two-component system chemotaxis response regulator CheB
VAGGNRHLAVRDGHLAVIDAPKVQYSRPSIDVLFESLARTYGARVIGVLLSGANVDGAAGIQAIRRAGGTTVVQTPSEAAHSRMPAAVIAAADGIDFVLPITRSDLRS